MLSTAYTMSLHFLQCQPKSKNPTPPHLHSQVPTEPTTPALTANITIPLLPKITPPHCTSPSRVNCTTSPQSLIHKAERRVSVCVFLGYQSRSSPLCPLPLRSPPVYLAAFLVQAFSCHHLSGYLHQHESPVAMHPQGKQRTALNLNLIISFLQAPH